MPPNCNRLLLLTTCIGLSLLANGTFAQPRPDGRGRAGGIAAFGRSAPLDLLRRPDVQSELELLDEQKSEALALSKKFDERRREILSGFADQFRERDASSEADRQVLLKNVQEAFRGLHEETEVGLSFLLPHQRKRLSQVEIQFRMRAGGGLGALASPEIGAQLEVTEPQREILRNKAMELGREFGKKVAELRREMQQQLLAELSPEQRTKFEELVGDPFEFQDGPPGGGRERRLPGGGEPR